MSKLALYHLTDQYRHALSVLDDADLPAEIVADTLEGLAGEIEIKATNVAAYHLNLVAESNAIKEAIDRMSARRKTLESRIESLRDYLKSNMERCGITEIKSPEFVLKIKSNPPAVIIDNEDSIPDGYKIRKEIVSIDKRGLSTAMKSGEIIPGARLIQDTRLEIR